MDRCSDRAAGLAAHRRATRRALGGILAACLAAACGAPESPAPAGSMESAEAAFHRIVVCGRDVPTRAPVVGWDAPPRYDAYSLAPRFEVEAPGAERPADGARRYTPGRREGERVLVEPDTGDLERLRDVVDLVVIHYDACGTSERCFRVLHDVRGLSAHFLVDLDGTVYQTLDLRDQAWHAAHANPRSIGIEIAHIGAYAPGEDSPLGRWYAADEHGTRLTLPAEAGDGGLRTPDFVARPAREDPVLGRIHGLPLEQFDLTREQYDSLVALVATLCATFPRIRPDVPRDERGQVRTDALAPDELARFSGVVGHWHVSPTKVDPGPAFDWERLLCGVRASAERQASSKARRR